MNFKSKFLILCLILFSTAALPTKTQAVSPSTISVAVAPENPSPGEDTLITLSSYASNLDSVLISWFVNGAKNSSGTGQKSLTVKAPGSGSETRVRAVINLPDGAIEKNISVKSSVMVLLWQANDSYVPPFYRGKAMPTIGSDIKVVAMPELRQRGAAVNPQNMTYSWQRNYTNDAEGSGYGKNFFLYTNDYLENSDTIGVTASTLDGQAASRADISIGTVQPHIAFYKNDSSLGTLWEQALFDGYKIRGGETVLAEPYFIAPKEIHSPSLIWNWFINDTLVDVYGYRRNLLPLRVEDNTTGVSRLRLEIESSDQILETASKEISVEF
jgi:hypothetical protein